jgi:hypothetical protein
MWLNAIYMCIRYIFFVKSKVVDCKDYKSLKERRIVGGLMFLDNQMYLIFVNFTDFLSPSASQVNVEECLKAIQN